MTATRKKKRRTTTPSRSSPQTLTPGASPLASGVRLRARCRLRLAAVHADRRDRVGSVEGAWNGVLRAQAALWASSECSRNTLTDPLRCQRAPGLSSVPPARASRRARTRARARGRDRKTAGDLGDRDSDWSTPMWSTCSVQSSVSTRDNSSLWRSASRCARRVCPCGMMVHCAKVVVLSRGHLNNNTTQDDDDVLLTSTEESVRR